MKTDKALNKYSSKRLAAISALLNKPEVLFTEDDFHKLRVEIKKLHAMFNLLDAAEKDFNEKDFYKPFKKIFRQAGKVRELQLQEQMLKKYDPHHSITNYKESIKTKQLIEKDKMFPTAKLSTRLKKVRKNIMPYIKQADKSKTRNHIQKLQNKIEKLRGKNLKASQIHKLRKLLKEFYYDSKSLKRSGDDAKEKKADKLQELMGKWHDYRVMNDELKKTLKKDSLTPDETTRLKKINAKVLSDTKMLFKKINAAKHSDIV